MSKTGLMHGREDTATAEPLGTFPLVFLSTHPTSTGVLAGVWAPATGSTSIWYVNYMNLDVGHSVVRAGRAVEVNTETTSGDPWSRHLEELEKLKTLPTNWNSYGAEPPNEQAIYWAEAILRLLEDMNFLPTKIAPSAEDGIGISFIDSDKYADVECFNSGEILAVTSDGQGSPTVWEVVPDAEELKHTLGKIREYLT